MDASMKSYLLSLNKAEGSVKGYQNSLTHLTAAQRLATIGQKAFTVAINMGAMLLASLVISKVIGWIGDLIHAQERAIEAGREAAGVISQINSDYKEQAETVNEVGASYAKLAQGVDQLTGKNKTLSTDNYEEFLGVSNQLAEMFPQLVKGYDENGNAMLKLNGDAKTITGTLNELLEVERALANHDIVEKLPDVFKGLLTEVKIAKGDSRVLESTLQTYEDRVAAINNMAAQAEQSSGTIVAHTFEEIQKIGITLDQAGIEYTYVKDLENQIVRFEDISEDGITLLQGLRKELDIEVSNLQKSLSTNEAKIKKTWNSLNASLSLWLDTDAEFSVMSDVEQAGMKNLLGSINWSDFDIKSFEDAKKFIRDNLFSLFSDPDLEKGLTNLFSIDTSNMSAQEIVAKWDDFIAKVKDTLNLSDDSPLIDILVGFTFDERSAIERLNNAIEGVDGGEGLKDKFSQEAQAIDKFVSELKSNSDIELFLDLVMKGEYDSFEELQKAYFEAKKALENEVYIEIVTENFEKVKGLVSSVTDALGGYRGCFFVCLCFFMKNAGSNGKNPCRDFAAGVLGV